MLPGVASKKRKPGRPTRRRQGKGLSGNPQRRAQQLQGRDAPERLRQQPRSVSTSAPGSQRTWPWWAESHVRVLAQVRATEWPSRLLDIETLAGRLVGDEFHARVNAPGPGTGLTPSGWQRALAEKAMDAMGADLADEGKDWPRLWAFCCGLADEERAVELAAEAGEFAARGVSTVPSIPVPWYQPTEGSDALVVRDAYGGRFLLTAPFSDPTYPADANHWYAWDLDWCADDLVVAAGVHDSADAALAEWQGSVGPTAATAGFVPCPPELGVRLLAPALAGSLQCDSVWGDEPVEFFREVPRLFRRAAALTASLGRLLPGQRSGGLADAVSAAIEEFLNWHAGNAWDSPGARSAAEEALELILAEWGPDASPDERTFFACSPHRIETCASILRDTYEPDPVNNALPLLPDWVQWCARRTELNSELADRALSAARAEAATPASEHQVITEREAPFRRLE
jgi:hypothetical protein